MRSLVLDREIREDELPAAYLLHGEDSGLARELVRELRTALSGGGAEEPVLELFDAVPIPWRDILDVARTIPFFFSPWRILAVEVEDADEQDLRAAEAKMLGGYLAAPTARTLLVVIVDGKAKKSSALHKAFAGAPKGKVQVRELEAPDAKSLKGWAEKRLSDLGKKADSGVIARLLEASGGDLPRLANEIEKLSTYVGDRPAIGVADADAVAPRVKEYENWALSDALEKGDIAEALRVVGGDFAEGAAPQLVVGQLGGFLRRLLLAKSLLREGMNRPDLFREFKPKVKEGWDKYQQIYTAFFSTIDAFSDKALDRLIGELQAVDLKIKTSDANGRTLIESFLAFYGRMRKRGRATSPARG